MRSVNSESKAVKLLRNIVLLLIFIFFLSYVFNYFEDKDGGTESALMANAVASTEFKGVFLRDEEVITYTGDGVLSYGVVDGGRLGNGSVIASVYPTDEQIKNNREIEKLERELDVLNKIQNPGTRESAQPSILSENIEENYRNFIYCRDTSDYQAVGNNMDDLLVLLSTYQMITDDSIDFSSRINDINTKLSELNAIVGEPIETITCDRSAYFVSFCDGYEDKISKETAKTITAEQINAISDGKSEDSNIIGKLIDGYEWYFAGVIDNSRKEYAVGDFVTLKFESASETFKASIIEIRDEGDPKQSVIVVSCNEFNYDLVQHRAENVELIKGNYTGLKVPREAIRFKTFEDEIVDEETGISSIVINNYKGVYILKGEQVEFKKIDVIYEGSDYVLSAVKNDDSSYLSLYDDIMIEGVDSNGK